MLLSVTPFSPTTEARPQVLLVRPTLLMAESEHQNIAPKLGDEEKKPGIASNTSKVAIPKTYLEACDGDKLVLYMRQKGESRTRMASAWSLVMGIKMTETNIGSRLSRID